MVVTQKNHSESIDTMTGRDMEISDAYQKRVEKLSVNDTWQNSSVIVVYFYWIPADESHDDGRRIFIHGSRLSTFLLNFSIVLGLPTKRWLSPLRVLRSWTMLHEESWIITAVQLWNMCNLEQTICRYIVCDNRFLRARSKHAIRMNAIKNLLPFGYL